MKATDIETLQRVVESLLAVEADEKFTVTMPQVVWEILAQGQEARVNKSQPVSEIPSSNT
jgi:hypothetical protein